MCDYTVLPLVHDEITEKGFFGEQSFDFDFTVLKGLALLRTEQNT